MGLPPSSAAAGRRAVVGLGALAVSDDPQTILSTYALGSCVGVVAYDPGLRVGGILHLMLPDSGLAPARAAAQPALFADTGLRQFFRQLARLGASPARLLLFVAGGANLAGDRDRYRIGERNRQATLDLLGAGRYRIAGSDLGGTNDRTLHLALAQGVLSLKTPRRQRLFRFPAG